MLLLLLLLLLCRTDPHISQQEHLDLLRNVHVGHLLLAEELLEDEDEDEVDWGPAPAVDWEDSRRGLKIRKRGFVKK